MRDARATSSSTSSTSSSTDPWPAWLRDANAALVANDVDRALRPVNPHQHASSRLGRKTRAAFVYDAAVETMRRWASGEGDLGDSVDAIAGDEKARAARSNFDGAFAALRARLDPDQYGGAPLLGVQGVAIICHGAASPTALQNGLRLAARSVRQRLNPVIRELLENNAPLLDAAKAEAE